ncbi:MAG: hypothetical protein EPO61_01605 [Nitrospirae bacterium]|nr:MAG: hypothetical protein EPO61_01605 [Nitrospirota bacterium]
MGLVLSKVTHLRFSSFAMVLFFIFCQVIGAMCALPDVALAQDQTMISEQGMVCPMDSGLMCPASLTSSPDRQVKIGAALDAGHVFVARVNGSAACIFFAAWSGAQAVSLQLPFPSSPSIQVLRI